MQVYRVVASAAACARWLPAAGAGPRSGDRGKRGARPFHLIGYDWGSIQSWKAVTDPLLAGRIASFTSISRLCLDYAALALRHARATIARH
jgi:hypothetical protein